LKTALKEVIPAKRELLKKLKSKHGNRVIGEAKVENVLGGMR
jgi:citrate synthase